MSFSTRSSFSTSYRTLGSVQSPSLRVRPVSSAASVYAGAGGSGSRISVSHSTSVRGGWGSGGLAAGMAGGLAGLGGIQTEKETMQCLNDRLASYLERVRSLEADNRRLESKIREHLEKKGPQIRDWGHYFKIIEDLRAQVRGHGSSSPTPSHVCLPLSQDRSYNGVENIAPSPFPLHPTSYCWRESMGKALGFPSSPGHRGPGGD